MNSVKKKILKYTILALLSPLVILFLSVAALYLPPVQNWVVQVVSDYISEQTDMDVSVRRVSLTFPLNLSVEGIKCLKPTFAMTSNDTVLSVDKAIVNIEFLPLLYKNVNICKLELSDVIMNTVDIIPEARVKGTVKHLGLIGAEPAGRVNLSLSDVDMAKIFMDGAHLDVALRDTVIEDTTTTENKWKIKACQLAITNSDVLLHMPGDTLQIGAQIGSLNAENIKLNLEKSEYNVSKLSVKNSLLTYNNIYEKRNTNGIDINHLAFDISKLETDSIKYCQPDIFLSVKDCCIKEQCGFELKSMRTDIKLDSTRLCLVGNLATPSSKVAYNADIEISLFEGNNDGKINGNIDASLSRADIMLLAGDAIPQQIKKTWPTYPLNINGIFSGSMNMIAVQKMSIEIPTVAAIDANGRISGFMKLAESPYSKDFQASIHADISAYNLSFIKELLDKETSKIINLPSMKASCDIEANGANYDVNIKANESKGTLYSKVQVNIAQKSYNADIKAKNLMLNHFIKGMGLGSFSGSVRATGKGFDINDKSTHCNATANIAHLQYDKYSFRNINTKLKIHNGLADVRLNSDNNLIKGDLNLSALLNSKNIKATIATDVTNIDLKRLGIVDIPLNFALCGHVDLETDGDQFYKANAIISDIRITDSTGTHPLDDIILDVFTRKDTTSAHLYCGDFETRLHSQGGYKWLLGCSDRITATLTKQLNERTFNQEDLRTALPKMSLYLHCGQSNPIYNSVKYIDIDFNEIHANINTSRENGINGNISINGLKTAGYQLDTISVDVKSTNDPLDISYEAHIKNTEPNDYVFEAFVSGNVLEHGITLNGTLFDNNNQLGLKIGAEATMVEEGIRFHLTPRNPIIAYEKFELNDDNYVLLGKGQRIFANVKMRAADGTGIQIYSTNEDSDAKQDITLSLNHLNIGRLLSSIPYAPNAEGIMDGDFHFIQQNDESFSISSEVNVKDMIYEGSNIGNIGTQLVYMPKEDGSHYVDGQILLDDNEIGTLTGSYNFNTDIIDAKINLAQFPLNMVNGFVPDKIIGLEGTAEGELAISGTTAKPDVNGELFLESASLISIPYGVRMRFDDDPIRILNSKLLFENFQMYASNDEPLIAKGELDFADTKHIKLDLRMKAENFMIIDAKENRNSEAYGKAFVNFYCFIRGELDKLSVRGKLDVLSSTNLYYILRDSPITTDNRLKELVTFVDFSSNEQNIAVRPTIEGINVDLSITVNEGAHIKCWLNTDHSNYLDLIGGGDLRLKYSNENMNLRGRYTIHEGEMKYSLPIIPLKTFTISPDSYIEFTGDVMNPRLNITATERTKASCNIDGVNRLIAFDCGVILTKTLNDMGLQFIIDAPEEQTINDQLAMMSAEERGKIAVTMLTTGMYLADGNTSNFSMNSALNSFLQSEINQIAGNALKSLDLSFGMDNSTEEDGTIHTDYTFKFAKRFWNNKLAISVGGKISSGPDVSGQNKSFFDNVEAQYRFSETSNQYMNLFYKRSVYDYLEGYVGQYGAGYMYKKKLQRLSDLFRSTPSAPSSATPNSLRMEKKDTTIQNRK